MSNKITPCLTCKEAETCGAHDWLKLVRHPWLAGELNRYYSFGSTTRAMLLSGSAGLEIIIECARFEKV
jgi:hypothetical protein